MTTHFSWIPQFHFEMNDKVICTSSVFSITVHLSRLDLFSSHFSDYFQFRDCPALLVLPCNHISMYEYHVFFWPLKMNFSPNPSNFFLPTPLVFFPFLFLRILKIENSLEYIVNNLEIWDNLSFEEKNFASKLHALNNAHFEGGEF